MMTNNQAFSLDGVTLFVSHCRHKEEPRHWGVGGGSQGGLSASHLAHLIVLSGLAMVPLLLGLPRLLPLLLLLLLPLTASVTSAVAPVPIVPPAAVLRLVLHLGARMLLRSPPLQSAWKWFRWREFGVAARCVNTANLNEASH